MALQILRGLSDLREIEPLVRIEIEDEAVGLLDIGDEAAPAMELDRAHLDAGHDPVEIVDIKIGFDQAVLLANIDMMDMLAEAAGVVLLEETVFRASLRAADEADRAV